MAKTRPSKKQSKKKSKSVLHGTKGMSSRPKEDPQVLFERATILLQTGQPDEALPLVERALNNISSDSPKYLIGLNLIGEIYVELGEVDLAREKFLRAVELDPEGEIDETIDGAAEKFLWLAQLSEEGGKDSVRWFERGVGALKRNLQSLEGKSDETAEEIREGFKKRLAHALCGVVEIYMTDLSWEEDAESRCEALITEALLVAPDSSECLQTLASVRISQLRLDDAKAALSRSLDIWKDEPPESTLIPDFPSRISLSRLLMEVEMENEALQVLERMVFEDDQSIETWYLGGWCLYLIGKKDHKQAQGEVDAETKEQQGATFFTSRKWLKHALKLCETVGYEDEKLKEHALELVQELENELGVSGEDEAGEDDVWEDETDDSDSDNDHDMADS
ncbi:uncharacterized protein GIQ15_04220 [Arthroderma uncinatum]|uniref:uncharacterized protein n=1 Tax=Arthroderma uncinatum TaxID=74035 RepID=UPI00144A5C71|nr:uncharacterized protein GIQ15_04220 [Arthroderma uncinatum]KAF3481461.1 hypothetical protein GIQ15_04220 [Arthroderma uncinatum]